ncbi:hypothetical protein CAPTEDRAFT_201232 [Capitella teleta]|uniref:Reverse transcriptase domain-containing protein n=1 Tax=Capitella teleta TaxID=283909 RepID=R7UVE0_CAPTE|nr:hypothetical protein CAPTEDRAFT_201232 [Capitella teleta]|eukprot:ELU10254.1 hypothetical protein CAPTEDRAFT_201232 [Capitella teleta]
MTNTFNNEPMHLKQWFTTNRLSLNISKTHAMMFSLNRQISSRPLDLRIHNMPINTTTLVLIGSKLLGIHIDNKLTWSTDISYICNKVSKSIAILIKVSKYLNKATLLMLYNSFVLPYLRYGNIMWGRAASVHVSRQFVLQKPKYDKHFSSSKLNAHDYEEYEGKMKRRDLRRGIVFNELFRREKTKIIVN